jgi:hypothetical protein
MGADRQADWRRALTLDEPLAVSLPWRSTVAGNFPRVGPEFNLSRTKTAEPIQTTSERHAAVQPFSSQTQARTTQLWPPNS